MVPRVASAILVAATLLIHVSPAMGQSLSCDEFDSWIWAQTIYLETTKGVGESLDPDNNGIACEELLPVTGFAPAIWTGEIPSNLAQGQLIGIADGDTLDIIVDGVAENVRLYRADTPETYFTPQ